MATPFLCPKETLQQRNRARGAAPQQKGLGQVFRTAGFTFVEFLIVLVLIGIFFAVSLPEIKKRFEYALVNQEARTAAQFLRYAQYRAIADHEPVFFRLDPAKNQYQMTTGEKGTDGNWIPLPEPWGKPVKLKSRLALEPPFEDVAYFPDGSSSGGSFGLKHEQTMARLSLRPGLGHVKVDFKNENE